MIAEIGNDVKKAKEYLQEGQVIGLPTETVYGLAGNGLDQEVVAKIFGIKTDLFLIRSFYILAIFHKLII